MICKTDSAWKHGQMGLNTRGNTKTPRNLAKGSTPGQTDLNTMDSGVITGKQLLRNDTLKIPKTSRILNKKLLKSLTFVIF